MNVFEEIKQSVEKSKMDGYKAAFLGAMSGWQENMKISVRFIQHVTGTGGESEPHYWPESCETCKEIAKLVEDWK